MRKVMYNIKAVKFTAFIWTGIEEVITALTRNQVVARAARGFESHPVRQLQGFCLEQKPCFFMSSLKKFPHGHPARLTAPDNADNDDTFDVASRCEYVFAVVEKSL